MIVANSFIRFVSTFDNLELIAHLSVIGCTTEVLYILVDKLIGTEVYVNTMSNRA